MDVDLAKYVGSKIKEFREKNGFTQDDIAVKLNTTRQTVSRYETGERKANQDMLFQLADIFHVPVDDFFPERKKIQVPYYSLTEKEKLDIGLEAEKLLEGMLTDSDVNFYGEPMDDASKESLQMAIRMALEMNKEKAKKKFTPKKYRGED